MFTRSENKFSFSLNCILGNKRTPSSIWFAATALRYHKEPIDPPHNKFNATIRANFKYGFEIESGPGSPGGPERWTPQVYSVWMGTGRTVEEIVTIVKQTKRDFGFVYIPGQVYDVNSFRMDFWNRV